MNFILLIFALRIIECKKHLRIIGGRHTAENEYLYGYSFSAARLEELELVKYNKNYVARRSHVCTSTILTSDWTLTAAHCVVGLDITQHIRRHEKRSYKKKIIIWYGHVRAAITTDAFSDVLYVVKHPSAILHYWDYESLNDVALVRTQPIMIKEYGKLSALDAKSLIGQEVHVVGYGDTNSSDGNIDDTRVLKKPLQVSKAVITSCSKGDIIMYPALCLGNPCGAQWWMLQGDSGGPAMIGINTLTEHFDESSKADKHFVPGYLTPISSFTDWMSSWTKK